MKQNKLNQKILDHITTCNALNEITYGKIIMANESQNQFWINLVLQWQPLNYCNGAYWEK